jgi:imidazolonepropionase
VDNVDVFCEKGVFDVNQSEAILKQAQSLSNLKINFHSNELYPLNSVEVNYSTVCYLLTIKYLLNMLFVKMAVKLKSKGASHLEETSDSEIELLSKSETVGILLPTTAIIMQLKRPPVRKMLDSGCIVALGSDFNPNAYCYSMV